MTDNLFPTKPEPAPSLPPTVASRRAFTVVIEPATENTVLLGDDL